MMKRLLILGLLAAGALFAQCTSSQKYIINCQTGARYCAPIYDSTPICQTPIVVTSLPATCLPGDVVSINNTSSPSGLYFCNPSNTWNFHPQIIAKVSLTAQGAIIPATTFYTIPANGAGIYRISVYSVVTQAATTSSTLSAVTISYTDADSGIAASNTVGTNSPGNAVGTSNICFSTKACTFTANLQAGSVIQYSTPGFLTSGVTSMLYSIYVKLEYLGQ